MPSAYFTHLLVLALLISLLFKIISDGFKSVQHRASAYKLGCEDAPSNLRPWWDFPNLLILYRMLQKARQGLLLEFLDSKFVETQQQNDTACRTLVSRRLGSVTFSTKDPENIKALLTTQRGDYSLAQRIKWFGPFIGSKSFFTIDGRQSSHARDIIKPALAKEHFADLKLAEKHNRNLAQCLTTDSSGWTDTIDLLPLLCRLTMDTSTEFLWGESVNSQLASLQGGPSSEDAFATAYDLAQDTLSKRMHLDRLCWLQDSVAFRRACRVCHEFVQPHIQRVLDTVNNNKSGPKQNHATVNRRYVFLQELASKTRDPDLLRDTSMALLLAGRDTTAALIGWLFYYLARDPKTYANLRSSIISDFGTINAPSEITFEKLKACKLLQWCIHEALRIRPPVPLNALNAVRDTVIPSGGGPNGKSPVFIPKGARVAYSVLLMQTDEGIWGPDAKQWRPERWAGRKHGWDFLPFNGGARICLGQQYALTLAAYTAVKLLQRFDSLENCDHDDKTRMTATLVSFSKNGVKVRLREAVGPA